MKTRPRSFTAEENPNMGKALFHCAIVLLNTEVHESSLLNTLSKNKVYLELVGLDPI